MKEMRRRLGPDSAVQVWRGAPLPYLPGCQLTWRVPLFATSCWGTANTHSDNMGPLHPIHESAAACSHSGPTFSRHQTGDARYIFPFTVQVFVVHPGMVLTNISRTLPAWVQRLYFLVMGRILLTPSQVGGGGIWGHPGTSWPGSCSHPSR